MSIEVIRRLGPDGASFVFFKTEEDLKNNKPMCVANAGLVSGKWYVSSHCREGRHMSHYYPEWGT